MPDTLLHAVVVPGHRVASGQAQDSPYPRGSIEMQAPFFRERGLDLGDFYSGTLNLDIAPKTFDIRQADYTFHQVQWAADFPPEDFSFIHCWVIFNGQQYAGYIYYPHPDTKIGHFQNESVLEVLCPFITGIHYGDAVQLQFSNLQITTSESG